MINLTFVGMETNTEFDEQMHDRDSALSAVASAFRRYRRGIETMGILAGYERAASRYVSWSEIEKLEERLRYEEGEKGDN